MISMCAYSGAAKVVYRIETLDFETYLALEVSDWIYPAEVILLEKVKDG